MFHDDVNALPAGAPRYSRRAIHSQALGHPHKDLICLWRHYPSAFPHEKSSACFMDSQRVEATGPDAGFGAGAAPRAHHPGGRRHVPYRAPHYRRWTPAELKLLGTMPDTAVARRTGHTFRSTSAKRRELGLAPARIRQLWTSAEVKLLGTMPDAQLARRLGRSPSAVASKREEVKLPQAKG
jgi:hypothetical protein